MLISIFANVFIFILGTQCKGIKIRQEVNKNPRKLYQCIIGSGHFDYYCKEFLSSKPQKTAKFLKKSSVLKKPQIVDLCSSDVEHNFGLTMEDELKTIE